MIHSSISNKIEDNHKVVEDIIDLVDDRNGNNPFDMEQMKYLKMLHESSPDPDSLSMISDYSEMGHEVKQSIRFSDMIISTYSDLKNPNKSVTVVPNTTTDPNMILRKYNMLSLATEFSKWRESNGDGSFEESGSDSGSKKVAEVCPNDSLMLSQSPSVLSDYSNVDHGFESHDTTLESVSLEMDRSTNDLKCPLQVHIDQKFEETFSGNRSSSDSDPGEDSGHRVLKIVRPAWAQSIFHRETLMKMPKSVRKATDAIRNFDLSKEKYLNMLNVSQLQLVVNSLMTQIEELNETLVATLITRDELRSEQTAMVIRVEDLTMKAKNIAQNMQLRRNDPHDRGNTTANYGSMHKFFYNLMCSPKVASSRVISFFTNTNVSKLPPPEYV